MAAPNRRALDLIRERRAEMARSSPDAINSHTGLTAAEEHRRDLLPPVQRSLGSPTPDAPNILAGARWTKKELDAIAELVGDAINEARAFDHEAFGKAIGELIRESVEPLERRILELERAPTLAFKGAFQRAMEYPEGSVVTHNDRMYVAVKDIAAGDVLRDGMPGWVLMFKGAPQ